MKKSVYHGFTFYKSYDSLPPRADTYVKTYKGCELYQYSSSGYLYCTIKVEEEKTPKPIDESSASQNTPSQDNETKPSESNELKSVKVIKFDTYEDSTVSNSEIDGNFIKNQIKRLEKIVDMIIPDDSQEPTDLGT